MTTSSRKNYNILALRGANVDDMEYVETFGLDPKVAYTPALNQAMLKAMYDENVAGGMDEKEALKSMKSHEKGIKKLLAQNGMLKNE